MTTLWISALVVPTVIEPWAHAPVSPALTKSTKAKFQ